MRLQEIIQEARQWAYAADDAGEDAMASKAIMGVLYLQDALDLYNQSEQARESKP